MKKIRADQIQVDQTVQFAGLTPAQGDTDRQIAGTGNPKSFHPIGTIIDLWHDDGEVHVKTDHHPDIMLAPNTKVLLVREPDDRYSVDIRWEDDE